MPLVEFPLEDGGSVLIETDETLPVPPKRMMPGGK